MEPIGVVDVPAASVVASIQRLEERVEKLEEALARMQAAATEEPIAALSLAEPVSNWTVSGVIALGGRTLVAIGGAYLLRALTDGGVLPLPLGTATGLAYATLWLVLCWRSAGPLSGIFHALTATLIAFPIIAESTTRFALVPHTTGAGILALWTAAVLLTARQRHFEAVAWFGAVGATVTAVGLAIATTAYIPYTAVLVLTGVGALWLGYLENWVAIRWPIAIVGNLMMLLVAGRATSPYATLELVHATVALQLSVLVLYLGSFVARTLFVGREVILFEVVQSVVVMAVCFGGAFAVLADADISATPLGAAATATGIVGYAFALLYLEPRKQWRTRALFTTHAVVLFVAGISALVPMKGIVMIAALLTTVGALAARRTSRLTFAVHACIFAVAGAWFSGLLGAATRAILAAAPRTWSRTDEWMAIAFIALIACEMWGGPARLREMESTGARALRLVQLSVLTWTGCGVALILLTAVLSSATNTAIDAATIAALRTVVLTGAAAVVILSRRSGAQTERSWVLYGLLVLIGIKLLVEDLLNGRPLTLFVALAFYGAALIALPRVARRESRTRLETL